MTLRKELSYFRATFFKFRKCWEEKNKVVHLGFQMEVFLCFNMLYLSNFSIAELLLSCTKRNGYIYFLKIHL